MHVWNGLGEIPADLGRCVVALGNFDGVHVGHQAVLRTLVEQAAARRTSSVAVTFDPHPIAVLRHVDRDLGPMALPQVPLSPQPFAVAEYFPTPGVTPFHDPRQHAVALCYVVVVMGDCNPAQDALDIAWLTPTEAAALAATAEMSGGHGVVLRQALAHLGHPV